MNPLPPLHGKAQQKAGNRTARFIIGRKRVKHGAKFHTRKENLLREAIQGG